MNYNIKLTPGRLVEINITTEQLWRNFITSWQDVAWDLRHTAEGNDDDYLIDTVTQVTKTLCTTTPNIENIRKLFTDGLTCMLLGDAMNVIDPLPQDFDGVQSCKIHVVNPTNNTIIGTIFHSQLVY